MVREASQARWKKEGQEGPGRQWVLGLTCREPDGQTKTRSLGPHTRTSESRFCHITQLHGPLFTVKRCSREWPCDRCLPGAIV